MKGCTIVARFVEGNAITLIWIAVGLILAATTLDILNAGASANVEAAQQLIDKQQYQQAMTYVDKALNFNPFREPAYLERGKIRKSQLRFKDSFESYSCALLINPNNFTARSARAAVANKLHLYRDAIEDLNKVVAINKNVVTTQEIADRAYAYYSIGDFKRALSDYDWALTLDPCNYKWQFSRALCLIGAKQHSKALQAFSTMVSMDPENNEVLGMRGYCRNLLNDKQGALKDFNLVLEREPDSSRWYQHRACLRLSMNNKKQALLDYSRASELEPGNAETQEQVLRLALDLKDYQTALVSYNRLSLLPNFQTSYDQLYGRARILILLGSYEKAICDLNGALKLKEDCDCVYLLAFCHSQLGDMAQARECLTVASQSSHHTASALLHQARIESSLGEDVSAVDHLSQALLLEPSNTAALVARGRLYQKREQWLSAREDFSKALTNAAADKEVSERVAVCNKKIEQNAHVSIVLPRSVNIDLTKFTMAQLRDNGERYYRQGNKSQACFCFKEIVRRNPGDIDSQRNLAHCLNDDHVAAIEAFERLAAVSKLTSADIIAYSVALAGERQFDRAIQLLEQAREVEPGNSSLSIELVKLLASAGKKDEAIALCSASICQQGIQRQNGPLQDLYVSLCHENRNEDHLKTEPLATPETDG